MVAGFHDRNQHEHLSTTSAQWKNGSKVHATMLMTAMMMSVITWAGRGAGAGVWLGQVDTAGGGGGRTTSSRRRSGSAAQIPQSCAGCVQKWWVGASCGPVSETQWMAAGQEVSFLSGNCLEIWLPVCVTTVRTSMARI